MSDRANAGERIRFYRERAGISSQTELAEKSGLAQNNISNWEIGYAYPQYQAIRTLCRALGCSADELLGLEPPTLSPEEFQLVQRYRQLDEDGRHTVDAIVDTQLRRLGKD